MKKKLPLHIKIIIGLVLGVGWALLSSYLGWNEFTRDWISPWGDIFIRLLKLIAIPLVLFSIISGVSGLSDISRLGRTGGKTLGMYLITTVTAVTVGLLLVNLIKPGTFLPDEDIETNRIRYELWAERTGTPIKDDKRLIRDPANAERVQAIKDEESGASAAEDAAAADGKVREPVLAGRIAELVRLVDEWERDPERRTTKAKDLARIDGEFVEAIRTATSNGDKMARLRETAQASQQQGPLQPLIDAVPENLILSLGDGKLMLQVIFFAILFGITMLTLPRERMQPVIGVIDAVNEIFVKMVDLVMRAAPLFVFCLMAGVMSKMASSPSEVVSIFTSLGWYALTVVLGLVFLAGVLYPVLLMVLVRDIPYTQFFKRMSPAQFLAFSTSSSAATLPVTMECVEDRLGASRNITSFVLPIGATVNMDGTSLYQAVAVIFLAQMFGVDLEVGQQIGIIVTATLASIGAAAVPSAGLIMLMIVLSSVGLNPEWIAIIFPIDRILDMCRTVVNVTGDATVCTIIAKSEGELDYPAELALDGNGDDGPKATLVES